MRYTLLFFLSLLVFNAEAQLLQEKSKFTKQDTLRGSITPEREWWDLNYYDLNIKVQPEEKYIAGYNIIRYKVLKAHNVIQIDLQDPLEVVAITQDNEALDYNKIGPAYFVTLKKRTSPWRL